VERVAVKVGALQFITFEDKVCILGPVLLVELRYLLLVFDVLLLPLFGNLNFEFASFGVCALETNVGQDFEEILIELLDMAKLPELMNVDQDIQMASIGT
jgi:hypothetical protein